MCNGCEWAARGPCVGCGRWSAAAAAVAAAARTEDGKAQRCQLLCIADRVVGPRVEGDGIVGRLALAVCRHQEDDGRDLARKLLWHELLEVDGARVVSALPRLACKIVAKLLCCASLRAPRDEQRATRVVVHRLGCRR